MFHSNRWLQDTVEDLKHAVDAAGVGLGRWDEIPKIITKRFPDSFCGIFNQNISSGAVHFSMVEGLERKAVSAYDEYYCTVNPLNALWNLTDERGIVETEQSLPISTLDNTEFYRDFLRRQGDYDAGFGLKIDTTDADQLLMTLHFPLPLANVYSPAIRHTLQGISNSIRHAAELNHLQLRQISRSASIASLAAHSDRIAFVLNTRLKLVEANDLAERAFAQGAPVQLSKGKVSFQAADANKWLNAEMDALAGRLPSKGTTCYFRDETTTWKCRFYPIPVAAAQFSRLSFGIERLALVLVQDIFRSPDMDAQALRTYFNLTPAEIRLCQLLEAGYELGTIADMLSLSRATLRSQLKSIFSKTGSRRQSELARLLSR
ncbi:DNA-binding CsgD family transcriptional regulator [Rhizobium aquaticum]|uniref:DNA-binding CsgD family transcriptional regulator n=1 Tax=Rhizobium aquaticum TaxID=1549636 RepID=A0ABV2IYX1_9HYPH